MNFSRIALASLGAFVAYFVVGGVPSHCSRRSKPSSWNIPRSIARRRH